VVKSPSRRIHEVINFRDSEGRGGLESNEDEGGSMKDQNRTHFALEGAR
jgi:hypothetical protein